MTIAGSIFLIAVGAILYFALNLRVAHVDIDIVGIILMFAGGAGVVLGLIQQAMWTRRAHEGPIEAREIPVEDRRPPREPRY
ncbi:MAG TPA: hypothetical protein VGC63_01090 [Solirubrobacterales bacterium]|jgi:hypothetical protein